ncbi:MAG: pantetheine-phosphate adenylyltransferase [Oscillospiraceae bacterium]|nr:pantetheine-phosphate adenylyltransferase [Oscillospiraceae bacterium]
MGRIALVAGTFDPVTIGHMDIISRASRLFDKVHVVIFVNPDKTPMFSLEQRLAMLRVACCGLDVVVDSDDGILVNYMKRNGIAATVRGVRNAEDMTYELEMAKHNKSANPLCETVILPCDPTFDEISSGAARLALQKGQDAAKYLPPSVFPLFNEMWRHNQGRVLPNADN